MRYYTKELLMGINSSDETTRTKAQQDWAACSAAYAQQFETVKKRLPQKFVKEFISRAGLHDYAILGIRLENERPVYSCELTLSNEEEIVTVALTEIRAFQVDIASLRESMQGKLSWGYSEFEITPHQTIRLSVLCDANNEMAIEFQKIALTARKRKGLRAF